MTGSSSAPRSGAHKALKHLGVVTAVLSCCTVQQLAAQRQLTGSSGTQLFSRSASGSRPASLFRPADPLPAAGSVDLFASTAAAGMFHFGNQPAPAFDAFRSAPIRIAWKSEESTSLSIFRRTVVAGVNQRSIATPFPLAALNRTMRRDLYLPLGSCSGGLRFDFDEYMRPSGGSPILSGSSASAMFTSSTLRNGLTFSAGAMFGARPTLFPPAGTHGPPAQKDAVPSLALKFSF